MKYLKLVLVSLCLGSSAFTYAQHNKRPMTWDDVLAWKQVSDKTISDDGKWVACKINPLKGDATVKLYNDRGVEKMSFQPVDEMEFSASSHYLLLKENPPLATIEKLKLKKTKEEKMPMNKLIIYNLTVSKKEVLDSIKSYKLSENGDWLAYQRGSKADSSLYVRSLDGAKSFVFQRVSQFGFAKKRDVMYYLSADSAKANNQSGLYLFTPDKGSILVCGGKGTFRKMAFSEKGNKFAFVHRAYKDSVKTNFALWLSDKDGAAQKIADAQSSFLPKGWIVSENETLKFSKDESRLFFGTAPQPKKKDETVLPDNRPNVQVWNWNETTQYTQQVYDKAKDLKKAYAAVYNVDAKTLFQLATPECENISLADDGNGSVAMLSTSLPYDLPSMWTGRTAEDLYQINVNTGESKPMLKAVKGNAKLSPKGKYAYWYSEPDSTWFTYDMEAGKQYRLTTPNSFTAWDEDNDVPDYPAAHGSAGWSVDDERFYIYDRYDVWQFDPKGATTPINLTMNGRANKVTYRLMKLDKEEKAIDISKLQYLSGFNETTKGSGFYQASFASAAAPKALLAGDYMLKGLTKAKNADAVIYTSETFTQYPDVRLSDLTFKKSKQLTRNDKEQQENFDWGTAELVKWTSSDGTPLEGVLYKPANFDPKKKYPMIVNFYERNSETLHSYRMPQVHRSTVDYHYYTSNGYIVFNPDVRYKDGYPGESCYNCVMPGIASIVSKGFVNEKAIGAQGHSWGAYQVAYLATRTSLFAAIESGAPVVNMLSAYGGIRWGSGLNRSFQYEHSQSRLGANIWEKPLRFIENSPLFTMDKVKTPILIMHNDNDGHVPWYQGIEYFVALKRLQKPVWLLNYTGEVHWPDKIANRYDFQKRMSQFFDHYLKGVPMPVWMSKGVKAVDQEFELGY